MFKNNTETLKLFNKKNYVILKLTNNLFNKKSGIHTEVQEIIKKAKELVGEGNIDKATQIIDENKDDLGDQFEKVKNLVAIPGDNNFSDKIKGIFNK